MNFMKRAMASITRKAGKSVILLVLVFILGNVIAGTISIEQSVKNTGESMLKGLAPVTTIEVDWRSLPDNFDYENMERLDVEKIEKIAALPMVDFAHYSLGAGLTSRTIERYELEDADENMKRFGPDRNYFTITGAPGTEIMERKMGKIEIADGRELTEEELTGDENAVLVSKEFAELNGLYVGSVFTLESEIIKYETDGNGGFYYNGDPEPEKIVEFEFTVVGIFEVIGIVKQPYQQPGEYNWAQAERYNTMYSSNSICKNINTLTAIENKIVNPDMEMYEGEDFYTPLFVLNDIEELENFKEAVEPLLPAEYFSVIDNQNSFGKAAGPMENMSSIASIVLVAGVGASLLILSLLITLFLRDRRHEIGIYLSLGERKGNIVGQILAEVLAVSFIAITLSLFTGNLLSGWLSNSMLENQVIAEQEAQMNGNYNFNYDDYNTLDYIGYGANATLEDLVSQYKVSLGANVVLVFYAVGILTILVSSLVPILYVLRLNPRKIML